MWRSVVRKALLNNGASKSKFYPLLLHHQVPHHETLPVIQSAFRFSHFAPRSHFHHSPRFFSSEANETISSIDDDSVDETEKGSENDPNFVATHDIFGSIEAENDTEKGFGNDSPVFAGHDSFGSVEVENDAEGYTFGSIEVENNPEKVENLLSLLQSSGTVDGSLESNLEGMGLVADEGLVFKVLETPFVPSENLMQFFSWVVKKTNFEMTTGVLDMFVNAICHEGRKGDVCRLWDLVKGIGEKEKGIVSTKSLNALIAQFSVLRQGEAAYDVFNKFGVFEFVPSADTYYFTIEALFRRSCYDLACTVSEKMLEADKLPDIERVGRIISYLCRGHRAKDAHLVYVFAKDKKTYPPASSIDLLISSLARIERADKGSEKKIDKELDKETISLALGLLDDYSVDDREKATKAFSSVVQKLCWIKDVDRAKKLLDEMIKSGPAPGNAVFNCVINGLTKHGNMEEALKTMRLMESRGLKPDVYTYSVIMGGYARGGSMEEACKILDEAKMNHEKLSPVTYHSLIRGFCKLEQFDKAVNLLDEMKHHGVRPSHDEYNKLIKNLCLKALDWETAEKLREDMKLNGLILNGRTSALITAVKEMKEGNSSTTPVPT